MRSQQPFVIVAFSAAVLLTAWLAVRRVYESPTLPAPKWATMFWLNNNRFDQFPDSQGDISYFPVSADLKDTIPDSIVAYGGGLASFSHTDNAILLTLPGELRVFRLPKGFSPGARPISLAGTGKRLFMNTDRAAYAVDLTNRTVSLLPSALLALPYPRNNATLLLDSRGEFTLIDPNRAPRANSLVASLPSGHSDPPVVLYDPTSDVIVCSFVRETAVWYKGKWRTFPFDAMLIDPINKCLWATSSQLSGMGETAYCYTFDGRPIKLERDGWYPASSPSIAVGPSTVLPLIANPPTKVSSFSLSITKEYDQ